MRRLLEADAKRVVAKVLPWLLLAAVYVYIALSVALKIDTSPDRNIFFLEKAELGFEYVMTVIGFAALIGVYADEFKSMTMITVVGRGLSREKYVIAKFLNLCILVLQMVVLTIVYMFILKALFGISLTPLETKHLILVFVMGYVENIAYVTIASIFNFLSESAAIGMFAYLTFDAVIPVTLALFLSMGKLAKYHLERFYISGITSTSLSSFIMGDVASGVLYLILATIVYICGAVVITTLIFRKKELNF